MTVTTRRRLPPQIRLGLLHARDLGVARSGSSGRQGWFRWALVSTMDAYPAGLAIDDVARAVGCSPGAPPSTSAASFDEVVQVGTGPLRLELAGARLAVGIGGAGALDDDRAHRVVGRQAHGAEHVECAGL